MIGETLVDRFKLDKRLGSGAQGEVYLARDLHLSRSVAIKIPPKTVDEDYLISFKREAKLLVKFEHANVVTLYDFYETDEGQPFLVMEYLNGQPLDERLRNTKHPLSRGQLRAFTKQICGALHKAHEAGLIHRDIKPSNVMLVDEGNRGERFVILDLGVAKLADFVTITNPTVMSPGGDFSGTIAYMSPEQLEGSGVDHSSDIYSFGTTLYQVITGKLPFEPPETYSGLFGFMQKVVNESPPPLSEADPDFEVSSLLEELIQQCMEKDKTKRPESMHVVSEQFLNAFPRDLKQAHADTQVLGDGAPPVAPPATGVRKLWYAAGGGMVLSLALLLLLWPSAPPSPIKQAPPIPLEVTFEIFLQDELKVRSGSKEKLQINVSNPKKVESVVIDLPAVPRITWQCEGQPQNGVGKSLKIASENKQSTFDVYAFVEKDAEASLADYVVEATVNGDPTDPRTLTLEIEKPKPESPPAFELRVADTLKVQSGESETLKIDIFTTADEAKDVTVTLSGIPGIKWQHPDARETDFGQPQAIQTKKSTIQVTAVAKGKMTSQAPQEVTIEANAKEQSAKGTTLVSIKAAPKPKLPKIALDIKPIRAGDENILEVSFDMPVAGKKVAVRLPDTPGIRWKYDGKSTAFGEGRQISVLKQSFTVTAIAELLRVPPVLGDVSVDVTIDGKQTETKKLPVEIRPPIIWPPGGSGFEIPANAKLYQDPDTTRPGEKRYFADKIFAVLPGGAGKQKKLRVPFWLIHRGRLLGKNQLDGDNGRADDFRWEDGGQSLATRPFYIMENKVSNKLVLAFLKTPQGKSKFDAEAWKGNKPPSVAQAWTANKSYEWLMNPGSSKNQNRPAMYITADEAHAVARWLTHQQGRLPRTIEWDIAAGTFDRDLKEVRDNFPNGPYRIHKDESQPIEIAIGLARGSQPPAEVGTSKDDVGAYSCRDMSGNGWEYLDDGAFEDSLATNRPFYVSESETLIAQEKKENPSGVIDVTLNTRGLSYDDPGAVRPLRYEDIARRDIFLEPDYLLQGSRNESRSRTIGFRAMLSIQPQE